MSNEWKRIEIEILERKLLKIRASILLEFSAAINLNGAHVENPSRPYLFLLEISTAIQSMAHIAYRNYQTETVQEQINGFE